MSAYTIQEAITTANDIKDNTDPDADIEAMVGKLICQIGSLASSNINESDIDDLKKLIELVENGEVKDMLVKHLNYNGFLADIKNIKEQIKKLEYQYD